MDVGTPWDTPCWGQTHQADKRPLLMGPNQIPSIPHLEAMFAAMNGVLSRNVRFQRGSEMSCLAADWDGPKFNTGADGSKAVIHSDTMCWPFAQCFAEQLHAHYHTLLYHMQIVFPQDGYLWGECSSAYVELWGGACHVREIARICRVGKTIINNPPDHHLYRWYGQYSQSVVGGKNSKHGIVPLI